MAEERWHDFAKEKPSEDMEGRNFIVSNGHYEKIATWCGYWENEPFMGDRLCDEVVRWKFYFTPEEEKANEATCNELFVEEGYNGAKYYDKDAVDALLAKKDAEIARLESNNKTLKLWYVNAKNAMHETEEACEAKDKDVAYWRKEYDEETKLTDALKAEIESLKARIQLDDDEMAGFLQLEEECGGGDLRNYIAELKRKLEDAKATAYDESVDAGMRERRLRRAFYKACANWAHIAVAFFSSYVTKDRWRRMELKCLKKAEEYR